MNSFLVDAVHCIHQASMDKRALARGGDGVEGEGGAEVGDGGGERAFTNSSGGNEQTVGAYVVTKKDNLVLVHQTHALKHNEPTADNNQTVLERRRAASTGPVVGELLSVGTIAANCVLGNGSCSLPRCMHLQAPWLVGFFI